MEVVVVVVVVVVNLSNSSSGCWRPSLALFRVLPPLSEPNLALVGSSSSTSRC